jgi:HEAT repeat protein
MSRFPWLNKKVAAVAVLVFALLGGLAWVERTALLSWYYVRSLTKADEGNRDVWAERVAGVGEAAVPDLLAYLSDADPAVCRNVGAGLSRLSGKWGAGDARTVALAMRCGREFNQYSAPGRQCVLELAAEWFRDARPDAPPAQGLLPACVRFVTESAAAPDADTQDKALELCAVLLAQPQGAEALSGGRDLVRNCLSSESAANRLRAVQLALHPGVDLLEQVTALLRDPVADVRRAAIIAVGPMKDEILDDVLLPSLHDPDPEVRRLCEVALESRERTPAQIRLGFYLTAPDPVVRIHVIEQLRKVSDIDPIVWLTRISHDPSPAIRAAAARAMSRFSAAEGLDDRARVRLDEMARGDPSATVCLLAKYYLENPERRD